MAARKQFLLRVDPDLWRELEHWAADDLRSVNAQVEWLLRDAVRLRRGPAAARGRHLAADSAPAADARGAAAPADGTGAGAAPHGAAPAPDDTDS